MKDDLCSIGSIVRINDLDCLVVGIKYDETDEKYQKKYLVVAYPFGYSGKESIRVVSDDEIELVQSGYTSSQLSSFNTFYVGMMDKMISTTDKNTIKMALESASARIEEENK